MNKIKYKTIAIIMTVLVVILISVLGVKKMIEPTQHEKQVAFLKEHENEMTEYIKSKDSKISKVTYEWSGVENETVQNGLPQGGNKILSFRINIIDSDDKNINSFGFVVVPDNIKNPQKIVDMYTVNEDFDYFKGGN